MNSSYSFNLPPEENVIERNKTITTYYAQLYKNEPNLYKWAGMAAFASFHIGEKLSMWNWENSGIKSISDTCGKQNRTLEDDFQVIRIINNKIFSEIGTMHLAFSQLDYSAFKALLVEKKKDEIIINAFEKLQDVKSTLNQNPASKTVNQLVWEANIEILWHEQLKVVQPLFDKLTDFFSGAMSFMASFDYTINHKKTSWKAASRFISFMYFNGFSLIRKNKFLPNITILDHRWYWISNDLLINWRAVEANSGYIMSEIELLSQMVDRNLILKK